MTSRSGTPTTPNAKRTRPMVTLTLSAEALAPDENETVCAIRRIGEIIGDEELATECVADLPSEVM